MGKSEKAKNKHKDKKDKKLKPTLAEQADKHALYQMSVQDPEVELDFFVKTFKELKGREPMSLREDFCGTFHISVDWLKRNPKYTAVGVDFDQPTLDWGHEHNLKPAGEEVASRLQLFCDDVRNVTAPRVDMNCALNFSYCIFKTRDELRGYFEKARESLNDDGMLFMDLFGGTECQDVLEEDTELDDVDATYVWEHAKFNPINNHIDCHIHFEFADGSRMEKAFTYHWRLWSLPEIKELLEEAGFSKVRIYWEEYEEGDEDDENMEGTGEYYETDDVENQESWMVYIVAEK